MYANIEAQSNTEEVAFVIIIIDAIPSENNRRLRPFADITESSHFGTKENEILFMLGSVFRITNVERDVNRRWIVSMTACDQEDIELNKLFSWFGDEKNVNGTDDDTFHSFGVLLLGEEHRLIAEIYTDLGRMYYEKKQLDKALDYYTRGLTIAQKILPDTHPEMGMFHTGIAVVYSEMEKIDEAKFHFEAVANIDLISFPTENPPLSSYYEALYIFYSHKSTIRGAPTTQLPNVKQNSSQRTGIIFYRCPWCHSYVWIYKAFFFCKGSPCFRCLRQLITLRPSRVNSRLLQYLNYCHQYSRLMEETDVHYLLARELRQQYLQSLPDKDFI
ncbi:unnamed protein product [Rotaria sp. Silwood2]|nr:unnamed protein product [Rotaria sp. Silwood2]CAF4364088.1 unnamed protein product [Rotaria sp. Silwood2]CAF4432222.1 unnamed protein product [Rotaria sp. Silwood2]